MMHRIISFSEQDVLCGRGGGTLRHPGNKKYRSLIKSSKPVYLVSSKNEKTAISRSIVAAIRKTNGRFLERSKDLQSWYDIGDAKATEKTSQALREGQPKLRKKMIDHGIIKNGYQSSSTERMIALLPTSSKPKIDPNPVFGNASYTSVDKINKRIISQQKSILEQSLNSSFVDSKPLEEKSGHVIGNCRFHPTDYPQTSSRCKRQRRMVTPPSTPPIQSQNLILRTQVDKCEFTCPFPEADFGANMNTDLMVPNDFDDSNSIMTFEMDDDDRMFDIVDDDQPVCQLRTPLPHQTNHFRALNELKDNVPIFNNNGNQSMFSNKRFKSCQFNGNAPTTTFPTHLIF